MTTAPAVHPVTPNDQDEVAGSLARAFVDDPVWKWLTAGRHDRFAELSHDFFSVTIRHHIHLGGAWASEGNGAGALWAPPNAWRTKPLEIMGLLRPSIRLFGTRTPTALSVLSSMEKKHPREPHWYLAVLGTDPQHQGKGHGSAVLQPVLDRCDLEGVPAYLESSKEANVPFYERHGFQVTGTHDFPKGPRIWLMWRDPRPPAGA